MYVGIGSAEDDDRPPIYYRRAMKRPALPVQLRQPAARDVLLALALAALVESEILATDSQGRCCCSPFSSSV